ncbi:MAG: hypothetical protein V3U80_00900 [Flavobacteriaceae bacterium]
MKKTALIICFLCFTFIVSAQNIVDANTSVIDNYFKRQENIGVKLDEKKPIQNNVESSVVVVQIGDYNTSEITTSSDNKKQVLIQDGNKNNYEYNSYYSTVETDMKISQEGNNNDIQIFGQNNLTKNMKITQKANNQTIIIKNYQ